MGSQVMTQTLGVLVAVGWSGTVSLVLFKLIDMTIGLRVAEEEEREGLDTASHGERAYTN
jgi:Amt family ammonium transporter